MPQHIVEQQLIEAGTIGTDGKIPIQILTPGWGSSGHYSPKVVEEAAPLFALNTPMYLDHASESERLNRPGRSVKDIAAKITTEATWDPKAGRLVAEAQLVPGPYRETILALRDVIGLSINGSATNIIEGEAEGRQGKIIEGLAKVDSVDFVTRAGRGGKILPSLLESARLEADVLHVDEATASDRMGHLRSAVRDTHGGDRKSAWVRDQDAEKNTVWFDVHDHMSDAPAKTYEQKYTVGKNDVDVALSGEPTEVRALTHYVPVNPAGPTPTKESREDTMAKKEIEESEYTRLTESAGRVPTLTTERDTEKARADAAEAERDQLRAREAATKRARARVTEANKDLAVPVVDRIVAEATRTVPLTDKGQLDEAVLDKAVDTARTAEEAYLGGLAEAAGAGTVTGFGGVAVTEGGKAITWDDIDVSLGIKEGA